MSKYYVIKFDKDEDPWDVVPKLWLTRSDIGDDDDDDDYDQCWYPNNDSWYKSKNQIIFNDSTKGWQLYNIFGIDDFQYDSLEAGQVRADLLNRRDFEDKRFNELERTVKIVENQVRMSYNSYEIRSKFDEIFANFHSIKAMLGQIKKQASAEILKPTLEKLLPIKSSKDLKTFETKFLIEDWISPALKELIGILTDNENMNESVSRILGTIFSRELAAQCTWDGNDGLKIKDLFVIKKIEVTLKDIAPKYDGFQLDVISWFEDNRLSIILLD